MVVSYRYAKSIFDLANEENIDISSDLNKVNALFLENSELFNVFCAENIVSSDKVAILEKILKTEISNILYNFIAVLIEKKRINLWIQIYTEFFNIYNDDKKILNVFVTTATELGSEQKDKIIGKISKKTGRNIKISTHIDESIIGGIVVKYDNTLLDNSVKTRLKNLNKKIKEVGV